MMGTYRPEESQAAASSSVRKPTTARRRPSNPPPPPPPAAGENGPPAAQGRSRAFTGCGTCRKRHLKCDEARPRCSTCVRVNLECEGYTARLFWVSGEDHDQDQDQPASARAASDSRRATSYRYPLFTQEARMSMSDELIASLGKRGASEAVQQIEMLDVDGPSSVFEGPFGVFRAFDPTEPDLGTLQPELEQQQQHNPIGTCPIPQVQVGGAGAGGVRVAGPADDTAVEELPPQDWALDDRQNLDHMLPMLPELSLLNVPMSPDQSWLYDESVTMDLWSMDHTASMPMRASNSPRNQHQIEADAASGPPGADTSNNDAAPCALPSPTSAATPVRRSPSMPRDMPLPPGFRKHGVCFELPSSAAPLLRYYKEHAMAGSQPSSRARISPWKMLILPRALETFAELSLWNSSSHTRCSIFYGFLSHAAFQFGQSPDTDRASAMKWMAISDAHQRQAREHLKRALKFEFEGEQEVEYSDLLMALLVTAIVTGPFHGPTVLNSLLIDAEHLIRLRGFPMRKSLTTRILHHMYTHARILVESTSYPRASTIPAVGQPSPASIALHPDSQSLGGQMSLRGFSITESSLGFDLDPSCEKPPDVGYTDIHLEISGTWVGTLYPDIYGIPEALVTLLSQTVSLANSKAQLEAAAATDPALSQSLASHIKKLEQNIWSWTEDSTPARPSGPGRPESLVSPETELWEHPQHRYMVLGLHQALIVYFYRRIYNMSAMVIQDAVGKALDNMQACLGAFCHDQHLGPSIAWCVFIVACEAVTTELQDRSLDCLQKMYDLGCMLVPNRPKQVVEAVWERRKETGDWAYSWPDLLASINST